MPEREPARALTGTGVTLLGVLVSTGITVALGMAGPWWVRILAGAATTIVLMLAVKLGTRKGHGPVARLARWTISEE